MPTLPRVVDVEYLGERQLRVTFNDGLVRELDFAGTLHGLLSDVDSDTAFAAVGVDTTAGTICWPNGIDLDPDVLHGDHLAADGRSAKLLREYRLRETG